VLGLFLFVRERTFLCFIHFIKSKLQGIPTGSITGGSYIEKYIGGIAGFLNGNNNFSQCYSTATITGNYAGTYYEETVGGLQPMDCWDSLGGIA